MKDFWQKNSAIILIIIVTLCLIVGGIFLFSKGSSPTTNGGKISDSVLMPSTATVTSGIVNGAYLPTTPSATVSLVEFGDYECPACGVYNPLVKQILTDFAGKIRYAFRNYPLPQHKNAPISSYAVEAAGLQGKYWQMHDKVFETQDTWANSSDPTSIFVAFAKDLGLDVTKFTSDINSTEVKNKVQADTNDGNTIKLTETPTFYLNGEKISLNGTYEQLKNLIEQALKQK